MKKIFLLFLAVAQYVCMTAQEKLTLRQCIETGLANNLDVRQAGLQTQTDEITWKQAKLDQLPYLNGVASHGINQGRSIDPFSNSYINQQVNFASYGLSSGLTLFNGFTARNTIQQNDLNYQASKMDWQQAKDNLTINIILAYLQVLTSQDVLAQSQNQATVSKAQVERLELLNKEGVIAPSLLSDLKGQYAADQLAIIDNQNSLESAKILLCQYMNVPYNKDMVLEKLDTESVAARYEGTPDNIYQTALRQFSLIRAAELRRQSAEKGVKVAKGGLFPTLSLNGNLNTNYSNAAHNDIFINTTLDTTADFVDVNGTPSPVIRQLKNFRSDKISYNNQLNNNLSTSFSLNLRVPIFNSFRARNQVKLAKITLQNNEWAAQTAKTQLQQSIEQAHINMNSAFERYKVLLQQVDAFTESFRAARIRFESGLGTSVDYLTAKNNLDRATINLITAKYDYLLRTKILDYYQAKPLW